MCGFGIQPNETSQLKAGSETAAVLMSGIWYMVMIVGLSYCQEWGVGRRGIDWG